jgi:hypothetical protein
VAEPNGRTISPNTGVTIGMAVLVLGVSSTAIFKAGQVLTEIDYLKTYIAELRTDVADMKRTLYRIERQPSAASGK